MFCTRLAAALLVSCTLLGAQTLPPGTTLPVELGTTLNARSDKAGQKIEGKLKQEVRIARGQTVKSGSRVTGHMISTKKSGGFAIVLQFDQLQDEHVTIPLNVSLRAMASSADVFQAGLPVGSNSDAESSDEWVTKQVGGEYVFRGRGYVSSENGKAGIWTGSGVWGRLAAGGDCQASDNNATEQSLWIFSTNACGLYGFKDVTLGHAGDTPPIRQISLESSKDILVRSGSGWLLIVNAAPETPAK